MLILWVTWRSFHNFYCKLFASIRCRKWWQHTKLGLVTQKVIRDKEDSFYQNYSENTKCFAFLLSAPENWIGWVSISLSACSHHLENQNHNFIDRCSYRNERLKLRISEICIFCISIFIQSKLWGIWLF